MKHTRRKFIYTAIGLAAFAALEGIETYHRVTPFGKFLHNFPSIMPVQSPAGQTAAQTIQTKHTGFTKENITYQGMIFADDGDGKQSDGELPVEDAIIQLPDSKNDVIDLVRTDKSGGFKLNGTTESYKITVDKPRFRYMCTSVEDLYTTKEGIPVDRIKNLDDFRIGLLRGPFKLRFPVGTDYSVAFQYKYGFDVVQGGHHGIDTSMKEGIDILAAAPE